MNCYEYQDYISSYIEKELTLSKVKQFDRHRKNCPACRDAYEGVISVMDALRSSRRATLTDRFNSRLQSRLRKVASKPTNRFNRYFEGGRIFGFEPKYAVASVVAMVVIVVLSINLIPDREGGSTINPVPLSTQQPVKEPVGIPKMDLPTTPAPTTFVADESKDDSTDSKSDIQRPKPSINRKIRLVKDRQ